MERRLHVGCGSQYFDGYVNLEFAKHFKVDIIGSACELPFKSDTFIEVVSFHVLEHLPRPHWKGMTKWRKDSLDFLTECKRVLTPGGKLIIECPDGDAVLQKLVLMREENRINNLFGLDRYPGDTHQWAWGYRQLKDVLSQMGMTYIKWMPPTDYHKDLEPCMRVEALK